MLKTGPRLLTHCCRISTVLSLIHFHKRLLLHWSADVQHVKIIIGKGVCVCVLVTSHRVRLQTSGSHLINHMLVHVPTHRHSEWSYFTTALRRWSKASAINKVNGYWLVGSDQDMRCMIDPR